MKKVNRIIIVYLCSIKCCFNFFAPEIYGFNGSVDSLIVNSYTNLNRGSPLKASFHRIQHYRDFTFAARGALWYDSTQGLLIQYTKPFSMSATYTDTMIEYASAKSITPFKRSVVGGVADSDPFQCLLTLLQLHQSKMMYKGSYDSLLLYTRSFKKDTHQMIFHRETKKILEYLFTDSTGVITGKSIYYYKKDRSFPVAVTYRNIVQGFLLLDSVSIGRIETKIEFPE